MASRSRATPFRCRLIIMVKEPRIGRVKTRLARQIGAVQAAWFYRHTASAVVARLSASRHWETVLAVAPDTAINQQFWPKDVRRIAQGRGDIGKRMQRAMHYPPRGPIILIGTDIPAIRTSHITAAFRALGGNDMVFGPASDGGYWLVGQRRMPRSRSMFAGVRWSTPDALSDTLRNLRGQQIAFVATLTDVDDADGFNQSISWCGRRVLPVAGRE